MARSTGRKPGRAKFDPNQQIITFDKPEDLRKHWNSMDWRLAGFKSETRYRQVGELIMAVHFCGMNDGCRAHVDRLIKVANRNSDTLVIRSKGHFFEVLQTARELGFIICESNWNANGRGPSDRRVCEERVAEIMAQTMALKQELRRSGKAELKASYLPSTPELRPSNTPLSENPPNLKNFQSSESPSTSSSPLPPLQVKVEEEMREMIGKLRERLDAPIHIEAAIRQALANGCDLSQVGARCDFFHRNQHQWPPQYRPGALYTGLSNATPDLPPNKGWPYRHGSPPRTGERSR